MFGILVAKQNPAAHIYASDWKNVLEVAQKNADAMGVGDRYHLIPGSAFETEFGNGYDLALVTNILHGFDTPTCTKLMRKVHAALNPAGRAAIAEYIPNSDRVSPAHCGCVQPDDAGGYAFRRCLHLRRTRRHVESCGFARLSFRRLNSAEIAC